MIEDFLFCLTTHSGGPRSAAVDADLVQVMLEFEQAIPLEQLEMPGELAEYVVLSPNYQHELHVRRVKPNKKVN